MRSTSATAASAVLLRYVTRAAILSSAYLMGSRSGFPVAPWSALTQTDADRRSPLPTLTIGIAARIGPTGIAARIGPTGIAARNAPTGTVGRNAPTGTAARNAPTGTVGRNAPTGTAALTGDLMSTNATTPSIRGVT